MNEPLTKAEKMTFVVILCGAAAGLCYGWKVFWFLTDDAFIAFRYVSNSLLGHGYVWNPPPFEPVEGYTSFLWILCLDLTWRITWVEPPIAANYLSLLCSYATLVIASIMLMRLTWIESLRPLRLTMLGLLCAFLLLNRTFLAWTSSGLETALFSCLVAWWVYSHVCIHATVKRVFCCSLAAALELTRPDGLLFCAATILTSLLSCFQLHRQGRPHTPIILAMSPLLLVAMHISWRYVFYDGWLPNTYYAKVTSIWTESGILYAFSFVLEYGLWLFIGLVSCAAGTAYKNMRGAHNRTGRPGLSSLIIRKDRGSECDVNTVVVLTLLAHFAFYTLIVGGDHFEYRVYAAYVPLIFVGFVWSLNYLNWGRIPTIGIAMAFVILSLPVQWTHWALTHNLNTRAETWVMRVPISPAWPAPLRWYSEFFDSAQSWLIEHHVCMRHQEHKIFWQTQIKKYPGRRAGMGISNTDYPVLPLSSVGVPAWVLPHINIIDRAGLNDFVIARTPVEKREVRLMAHDRFPPTGYVESFRPNVTARGENVTVFRRPKPLTAAEIRRIESFWRRRL